MHEDFIISKIVLLLPSALLKIIGALAQSVEQQTENLRVAGSIPAGTTKNQSESEKRERPQTL